MNDARALIGDLSRLGVTFSIEGGRLILDGPDTALPDAVIERVRAHKAEILGLLKHESSAWAAEDWRAFFNEKAGIAEFDGGLTRTVAEDTALEACLEAGLDIETARSILGVDPDGLQPPRARTYH